MLAKEITSNLIMATNQVKIDITSSASCSKNVKKYKTCCSKESEKKSDFIQGLAKSIVGYENKFPCVCYNVDISCAPGGANNVLSHQEAHR